MSSMEHFGAEDPGWARSVAPEYAILALVMAFAVGLALAWPWW